MSYLVVACKSCGTPRVAERGRATTTCHRCGKRIQLEDALVHARTDSLEEAQDAVGQVNATRGGGELARPQSDEPPARDGIDRGLAQARTVSGQASRVRQAAKGLTEEMDTFTRETWVEAMGRLGVDDARAIEHLERLVQASLVSQPRSGVYRYVA